MKRPVWLPAQPSSLHLRKPLSGLVLASLLLMGCDQANDSKPLENVPAPRTQALSDTINEQLSQSAFEAFTRADQQADQLVADVRLFLESPNTTTLSNVRSRWRDAYNAFLQARFYGFLPVSDPPEWQRQQIGNRATLTLLDTWPIEGGYIDYLADYPYSGIVNDLALELTADNLLAQHGLSDVSSASLGFHPLEFLLWGENGQRSASDYLPNANTVALLSKTAAPAKAADVASADDQTAEDDDGEGGGDNITDWDERPVLVQNNTRRRDYLLLVATQIQEHVHRLERRWEPANGYYSTLIERSKPGQALSAGLLAGQKLLHDELISKRLVLASSEFSQSSRDDLKSLVQGLESWINSGVLKQLPGDTSSLRRDWEEGFQNYYRSLEQHSSPAHPGDEDEFGRQNSADTGTSSTSADDATATNTTALTPQKTARHLLALLRRTASQAGVTLAVSGSGSSHY